MPRGRQPRQVLSPLTTAQDNETNLLENMIEEIDDSTVEAPTGKARPKVTDPEWSEYVLSLLREDEKDEVNSYPKTEGLKRIAQLLIGPISSSVSRVVNASPDFACVTHTLFLGNDENLIEYTAAADAIPGQPPYDKFLTSIAATRAYGRALRDALNLKNISVAEEVEEEQMIKPAQKRGIDILCKNLKIDVEKLLQLLGTKFDKLEKLTWSEATSVMSKLNKFSNRQDDIPQEILGD